MKISKIAIVSEDISSPLDEGFKKATFELAAALSRLAGTTVFAARSAGSPIPAEHLPHNKLLLGSAFSGRLKRSGADAVLYVPQASATPMSLVRAALLRRQSGGRPTAMLSLQRRTFSAAVRALIPPVKPDLVLVLSSGSMAAMEAAGIPVRRVPLGVDPKRFRPPEAGEKERLRSKYGLGKGKIALHIGHVSARRNLRVLASLPLEGAGLAVITSTSTRPDPEVREWLGRGGVTLIDRYVETIEEIYRLADCYVFPTTDPGGAIEVPLSVLEAMATGLPVVTMPFGGIPDLFREGRGLYIAAGAAEFAEKFSSAMAQGETGTREMAAGLTWENAAREVLGAMEQVLK